MPQLFSAAKERLPKLVPAICRAEKGKVKTSGEKLGPTGRCAQTSAEHKKGEHGIPEPVPTAVASSCGSRPRPCPALRAPQHSPGHIPTSRAALTVPLCTRHLRPPAPTSSHQLPPSPVSWNIIGCSRDWVHGWRTQRVFISGDVPERVRERGCTRAHAMYMVH